MRQLFLGVTIALSVIVAYPAGAQVSEKKQTPPTADDPKKVPDPVDQVLAKFLEASGGAEALGKLKTRVTEGTFEVIGQAIKGKTRTIQKGTDTRAEMDTPFGKETHGLTGKIAWELSPRGDRIKTPEETGQLMRTAYLDFPVRFKSLYAKIEHKAVDFKGTKCAELTCTPLPIKQPDGKVKPVANEVYYFDNSTGLIHAMKMESDSPFGKLKVVVTTSDYRDVDGIKIPFLSVQEIEAFQMEMRMVTTKVEQNVELPAEEFKMPDSIQKILDKEKQKDAEKEAAGDDKKNG